jgi:hypothetical protein
VTGHYNDRPLAGAVSDCVLPGLVLGFVFGTWNVVISILAPLMDDTPLTLASFYGPMFTAWGVAGGVARASRPCALSLRTWPLFCDLFAP